MTDKTTRDHIVEAADRLFYRQGYDHTSFSDIASAVHISRGNFYFYFKTKDEILDAVIQRRVAETREMLDRWEINGKNPVERINSFINILIANRADIKRYGCPIGTLCTELAKLNHPSQPEGNVLFTSLRTWLRRQFILMGREGDADVLAMHLLARSQGVATLASAFHDDRFIKQEVTQMRDWLNACLHETVSGAKERAQRRRTTHKRKTRLLP